MYNMLKIIEVYPWFACDEVIDIVFHHNPYLCIISK